MTTRVQESWKNINTIIEGMAGKPEDEVAQVIKPLLDAAMQDEMNINNSLGINIPGEQLIESNMARVSALSKAAKVKREQELVKTKETETTKQEVQSDFKPKSVIKKGSALGLTGVDADRSYEVKQDKQGNIVGIENMSASSLNSVSVNVDTKNDSKQISEISAEVIKRGMTGVNIQPMVTQLIEKMSSPDFQSGKLQPAITFIQGLADDLGLDIDGIANAIGIEKIGNLADKEEVIRLTREVLIQSFEFFKGNLNAEEVRIAEDSVTNLGRSEDANLQAVAALAASNEMSRERAVDMVRARTTEDKADILERQLSDDGSKFIEIKNNIYFQMKEERDKNLPPDFKAAQAQIEQAGFVYDHVDEKGNRFYLKQGGDPNKASDYKVIRVQ